MKTLFLFSVFVLYGVMGIAQSAQAVVSGTVKSLSGESLYGSYIYVKDVSHPPKTALQLT